MADRMNKKTSGQWHCSGCQVRSCRPDLALTEGEPTTRALARAIVHSIGVPLISSLAWVVMADAFGLSNGVQLLALVLGLGLGVWLCKVLPALPSRQSEGSPVLTIGAKGVSSF